MGAAGSTSQSPVRPESGQAAEGRQQTKVAGRALRSARGTAQRPRRSAGGSRLLARDQPAWSWGRRGRRAGRRGASRPPTGRPGPPLRARGKRARRLKPPPSRPRFGDSGSGGPSSPSAGPAAFLRGAGRSAKRTKSRRGASTRAAASLSACPPARTRRRPGPAESRGRLCVGLARRLRARRAL
ncbi:proapoptotic nucleolar protein 1 [Moschus berezovskii]|uniref:proapoptotic nucleolar protein 1 n=1 Tax=Moschus berezovskii TaxID=68408 RepID=UPI002443C4E5|nr:proapoptotic nucleolar protein 1 [Moschus berezovskii]